MLVVGLTGSTGSMMGALLSSSSEHAVKVNAAVAKSERMSLVLLKNVIVVLVCVSICCKDKHKKHRLFAFLRFCAEKKSGVCVSKSQTPV